VQRFGLAADHARVFDFQNTSGAAKTFDAGRTGCVANDT